MDCSFPKLKHMTKIVFQFDKIGKQKHTANYFAKNSEPVELSLINFCY